MAASASTARVKLPAEPGPRRSQRHAGDDSVVLAVVLCKTKRVVSSELAKQRPSKSSSTNGMLSQRLVREGRRTPAGDLNLSFLGEAFTGSLRGGVHNGCELRAIRACCFLDSLKLCRGYDHLASFIVNYPVGSS